MSESPLPKATIYYGDFPIAENVSVTEMSNISVTLQYDDPLPVATEVQIELALGTVVVKGEGKVNKVIEMEHKKDQGFMSVAWDSIDVDALRELGEVTIQEPPPPKKVKPPVAEADEPEHVDAAPDHVIDEEAASGSVSGHEEGEEDAASSEAEALDEPVDAQDAADVHEVDTASADSDDAPPLEQMELDVEAQDEEEQAVDDNRDEPAAQDEQVDGEPEGEPGLSYEEPPVESSVDEAAEVALEPDPSSLPDEEMPADEVSPVEPDDDVEAPAEEPEESVSEPSESATEIEEPAAQDEVAEPTPEPEESAADDEGKEAEPPKKKAKKKKKEETEEPEGEEAPKKKKRRKKKKKEDE